MVGLPFSFIEGKPPVAFSSREAFRVLGFPSWDGMSKAGIEEDFGGDNARPVDGCENQEMPEFVT